MALIFNFKLLQVNSTVIIIPFSVLHFGNFQVSLLFHFTICAFKFVRKTITNSSLRVDFLPMVLTNEQPSKCED